jgi:hypothetical protein
MRGERGDFASFASNSGDAALPLIVTSFSAITQL